MHLINLLLEKSVNHVCWVQKGLVDQMTLECEDALGAPEAFLAVNFSSFILLDHLLNSMGGSFCIFR